MGPMVSRGLAIRRLLLGHGFGSEHARLTTTQLSDPGLWHGGGVTSAILVYCNLILLGEGLHILICLVLGAIFGAELKTL